MPSSLLLLALTAQTAFPPLAAPVRLDRLTVAATPNASVRAATLTEAADLSTPRTFHFICVVTRRGGRMGDCIDAAPWRNMDLSAFQALALQQADAASEEPLRKAARARLAFYRVRLSLDQEKAETLPTVFIDETVRHDDRPAPPPAAEAIMASDLEFTERPDAATLASYYPILGLRLGATARVSVQCHILPSGHLFCDQGAIVAGGGTGAGTTGLNQSFILATYQALGSMRVAGVAKGDVPIAGRTVKLTMNWALP